MTDGIDQHGVVTERKSPIDQVVDLFFFAPLGLLMNAEEVVPQLAERGRKQVTLARMMGKYTVKKGRARAENVLVRLQHLADSQARPTSATASANGERLAPATTSAPLVPPQHNGEVAATLAIPDYDSLSASQVVPRLESLSAGELDAVRAYESSHRGRKTILNKIDQLKP
ncbi:MAG TPA: hypothetical protein VHI95_00590 [Acidimicrobiales bacterium]|jgi:hypothetical protein|nr:hypothetical protein [Acidimicrobiales bacterium]